MKSGKGLARKTPLTAKTGLTSSKGLSRTSGLARSSGLSANVPTQRSSPLSSGGKKRQRPSEGDHGPIPRELAAWVLERAEGCCDWCGRYCLNGWYSRQHRLPRQAGGRFGAHTAANLVLLCGSATSPGCHEKAERSDIPAARRDGFRLREGDDPAVVPILRHGTHLVLPTAEGWTPVSDC